MTAKEYLKQISRLESFIKTKKERLAVLNLIATSCSAPALTGMPKNPSPPRSKLEDAVCRAIDLENEIKQDEARLQQKKMFLLDLIGKIDNTEYQTVLISRYFMGATWGEIALKMFYTERWIFELHGRALQKLDEIITREEA